MLERKEESINTMVGNCACDGSHGSAWPRHLPLLEKEEQNSSTEQQDTRRGGGETKNQRC